LVQTAQAAVLGGGAEALQLRTHLPFA